MERSDLLSTREVARFVAKGFLRFDGLVPAAINEAFLAAVGENGPPPGNPAGTPLAKCYAGTPVREFLDAPRIQGILTSLVGPEPLFDHHGVHFNGPASRFEDMGIPVKSQPYHQDSTIDVRRAFDVQMFWFPHEVTAEMAGTRYLPGSHLRVVSESAIGRYQNILGQEKVVCPAGTVLVCHHGLWHGGEVNRSETTRYMLKIRVQPSQAQVLHWNLEDFDATTMAPRHIFDPTYLPALDGNDVRSILMQPEPWFEFDTGRLEYINRIHLWRYLIGDDSADVDYWVSRIENDPGRVAG